MANSQMWLITGAASGLGYELAKAALAAGHKVTACCRDIAKNPAVTAEIEKLGGIWLQLDVAGDSVEMIIQSFVSDHGAIDVLINNAGYGLSGSVEDTR